MKTLIKTIVIYLSVSVSYSSDYILMDDETETYISEIVEKIRQAMGYESKIKVYISSDQTINACAIQSGDIVVNAGAIINCSNYKELIAILAHEVGHIEGRHIQLFISHVKDFVKAGLVPTLIGVAITAISGNPAALMAGVMGGQSISQGMALSKMRQKEEIADTKAAETLKKLGWYIFDGCVAMHKKLESKSFIYNEYISTHPISSKRIKKYKEYESKYKDAKISDATKRLFERYKTKHETLKKKLQALVINNEFLPTLFKNPKTSDEKYARAIILYRQKRYAEAINLIESIQNKDIDQLAYYTEIKCMSLINLGRSEEATKIAREMLKKITNIDDHGDLVIIYAESVSSGRQKQDVYQAIKYLKRILSKINEDISSLHMLGKLYSVTNQNDEASYCIAKVAYLHGDLKLSKYHAQKAKNCTNPTTKRKLNDLLLSIQNEEHSKKSLVSIIICKKNINFFIFLLNK